MTLTTVFKFVVGLLLLPVCWVSLETFFLLFKREAMAGSFYQSPGFFFFSIGSVFCFLFFLAARRNKVFLWFYVLGHELTHALFVLIFRGRVSKIHVTTEGGHIKSDTSNFMITLAPYFFPFYTIVAILIWGLLEWQFFDFGESGLFWLYGLIGFTWMYHICYTVWMLRQKQTDVQVNGKLFSFSVILLINVLTISALMVLASPTSTFKGFALAWMENLDTFGLRLTSSIKEIHGN